MNWKVLVFVCIFFSCSNENVPSEIAIIFEQAGKNKIELKKVIEHFNRDPQDSLKLRAALYLIKNMQGSYYYEGEKLDQYLNYLPLINRDSEQGENIIRSFSSLYGPFSTSDLKIKFDLEQVKAKDIIENVDMAFKVWQEQPWGKDINFDQFCEYILPFRIADEVPENNREMIYKQFNPVLDSVRKAGGSALAACIVLNNKLRDDGWLFTTKVGFLPHFPSSALINYRTGSCRDMTNAAVYIMRAVGIPVGIDMVQQWPYKNLGHIWNTVLDRDGKNVMFMCVDQSPGIPHKAGTKKGKVYRQTYAINPQSLAMQRTKEDIIPAFFSNPKIKDVTDEYVPCFNVSLSVVNNRPRKNNRFAYLSVFNNTDWIPVHWGEVKDNQAIFSKMEGNLVYLPGYYDEYERVIPANYPFILNENGRINILKPDTGNLNREMVLTRIFPIIPDQFVSNNLIGARFQAANQADFSDAENLEIITNPMPFWNRIIINNNKRFRYARFSSAPGMRCAIAEFEFHSPKGKLNGRLIGTKESYNDSIQNIEKAIDNNVSTCFVSKFSTGSWVGLDFGKPETIKEIRYSAPLNEKPDKKVTSDNRYELFYWNDGKWQSIGTQIASSSRVIFSNVPSNALYMLKNSSKEADHRIFTFKNGKQIWW